MSALFLWVVSRREVSVSFGADLDPVKVNAIKRGQSPIVERGLGDLLAAGVEKRFN